MVLKIGLQKIYMKEKQGFYLDFFIAFQNGSFFQGINFNL